MSHFLLVDLGRMRYKPAWDLQLKTIEARSEGRISDVLYFVEHDPVITLGTKDKWNQLHATPEEIQSLGIDFYKTERGGGATYHGPGQLVGYPIVDLREMRGRGLGVADYLVNMEEAILAMCHEFGVNAERRNEFNPDTGKPYRAVWYLEGGKRHVVCTKGVRVKGGITFHGFALYVNEGESHFDLINPCGFDPDEVSPITMQKILGAKQDMKAVKASVAQNFRIFFKYGSFEEVPVQEVLEMIS